MFDVETAYEYVVRFENRQYYVVYLTSVGSLGLMRVCPSPRKALNNAVASQCLIVPCDVIVLFDSFSETSKSRGPKVPYATYI